MEKQKDFSQQEMIKIRKNLEEATQQDLIKYSQAKKRDYIEAQNYVLD
ncbi:MAG: hypothetical protein KJ646_01465 [Nanoarchaeota archaeon]|nr:hypothetical protein [Nanoarchaeota archaeon]MBU4116203.1 hypothetical protein [Nanoarchaeota archaeon]